LSFSLVLPLSYRLDFRRFPGEDPVAQDFLSGRDRLTLLAIHHHVDPNEPRHCFQDWDCLVARPVLQSACARTGEALEANNIWIWL
jgi:hypothetical protein